MKAINDLEHAASFDATVREKIAALPPEVSDAASLAKINGERGGLSVARISVPSEFGSYCRRDIPVQ